MLHARVGVAPDFVRSADCQYAPLIHHRYTIGNTESQLAIVRDNDGGDMNALPEFYNFFSYLDRGNRIQPAGWLVVQDQLRLYDQSPRYRHALFHWAQ